MTNTKELVTKAGTKFILNDSITYGDHLALKDVYLSDKDAITLAREADKKGFEMVVVSIDGRTENLYEEFKKLPYQDVSPVLVEIKAVLNPKKD